MIRNYLVNEQVVYLTHLNSKAIKPDRSEYFDAVFFD